MLYLLDKEDKTVKWNGIPLHEASSAIVKEETNGDFYLTVHYPITDSGVYQLIKEDMLIKAPVPVLGAQLFRIKKPIENDDSLDITAYHITDDIMQRSIRPVSVVGQSCAMALSQMAQNAKTGLGNFSFASDIMDSRTFNTTETETLYSVLMDGKHSIVGTWEGELVRDNFALSIKRSRGSDRGVVITTHKNLKSYQRTKNSQGIVTRIHATSTFKPEGAKDEVTLRVTVDSPLIGNYPYINEKEYENNDAKTIEELRKWAEAKFKNEGIDKVSDAIDIEAYELDGQVVHLGDTVNIKSSKHSVDIYKKAIAYEYNALTEEYISITFDDKPGVRGSGVSSGVSNAADVILSANQNAQEIAIERAVKNANQAFDAEFEKRQVAIDEAIEQSKADAEEYVDAVRQEISAKVIEVDTKATANELLINQKTAEVLAKAGAAESLAQEAKNIGNQAKADAVNAINAFNQTKETVDAHTRTIGSVGESGSILDNISQVTQTAAGLVSRVSLITDSQNLVYDPTRYSKYVARNSTSNLQKADYSQYSAMRINHSGLTGDTYSGFKMPLRTSTFTAGEKLSLRAVIGIDVLPDSGGHIKFEIKNQGTIIAYFWLQPTRTGNNQVFTATTTVNVSTASVDEYGLDILINRNGNVNITQISIVRGDQAPTSFVDSTTSQDLAISTQVSQLAGSYAIQNLNSAGDLINGLNLGADGVNRISGKLTRITGETIIDNAVIKSGMVDKLKTANFEAGSVTATIIEAEAVTADKIKVDQALFNKLMADEAYLRQLFAKNAFITSVQAVTLSASKITSGILASINNTTNFNLQTGWIDMNAEAVGIRNLWPNYPIQYLVFGRGSINGKTASYSALMSNSKRAIGMNDGSAGIQIWNAMDNTTAINLYGDEIAMMYNANDSKGLIFNNVNNTIGNVDNIYLSGYGNYNLVSLFNNIYDNLKLLHINKTTETNYSYTLFGPR